MRNIGRTAPYLISAFGLVTATTASAAGPNPMLPTGAVQLRSNASTEQRLAALEAQNAELTAKVAQLTSSLSQLEQAYQKESFADRFRLLALEKWADLKNADDNDNFTALWTSTEGLRAWGDSFYKLYLQHAHSYLDDATAAGRYAVYQTSSPYPFANGAFGSDQLDILGPKLAGADERFVYEAPLPGPADGRHLTPLPPSLPAMKKP